MTRTKSTISTIPTIIPPIKKMERNTKLHLDGSGKHRRGKFLGSRYLKNKQEEIKLMIIMARLFLLRLRRQPFMTVGLIWVLISTIQRMKFPFVFHSIFSPQRARKFLDRLGGRNKNGGNITHPHPQNHHHHKDRIHQFYYSHYFTYDEPYSHRERRRLMQERRYS